MAKDMKAKERHVPVWASSVKQKVFKARSASKSRRAIDMSRTPRWAVEAIAPYLPKGVRIILDPCIGTGGIADALSPMLPPSTVFCGIEHDAERVSDLRRSPSVGLVLEGDALRSNMDWPDCDVIVMHPPLSKMEEFIRRAVYDDSARSVFALARLSLLTVKSRRLFWSQHKANVYVLTRRLVISGVDWADYAWFEFNSNALGIWRRLEIGEAPIDWTVPNMSKRKRVRAQTSRILPAKTKVVSL